MPSAARATPSSMDKPGYFWPLNVRQYFAPMRTLRSIARFCRSTCLRRSSGSGWVKFGEKQSIDVTCPVCSIAAITGATSASS